MISHHRTWLAVPVEEKDAAVQAHPRLENGQQAIVWDKEHKLWYARPGVELDRLERWLPRPHTLSMNADDPVTEFAQKLEEAGLVLKGLPVMDGTRQRVPTRDDRKGAKSGVYKAFLDGRPAGWYRNYRTSDEKPTQWVYSGGNEMDPLARLHLRAQAQQTREDNARKLEQQYDRQAAYAERYVSRLPQATTSPYLIRKGVQAAEGVRITPGGELVVPFSNAQGQIRSYQRIPETGGKDARILKDSEKTGNWFAFGTPVNGQPLLFAEGYSTAASVHEATGLPVLMTIDAGNMIAVARNARAVWPDSRFIFCADNDHHLRNPQTGEPENKGLLSATKAAELTNGQILVPVFTSAELDQKLTDFNDLDVSRGREAFHQEINVHLIAMGVTTPFSDSPGIREALTRAGVGLPSVQETTMEKEENTGLTPIPVTELEQQATQDYARLKKSELDPATLVRKAEADPAYKAGLLSAMSQDAGDMQLNGQKVDATAYAEESFRALTVFAQTVSDLSTRHQAEGDFARYSNQELDAATLVQNAEASPAYREGLLSALAQDAGDLQLNGQRIDSAAFAENALRAMATEVQTNAENTTRRQAESDFTRYSNQELDAATLVQNAEASPAYREGLLSALAQDAGDLQFNGQPIDAAAFAENALRAMATEVQANAENTTRRQAEGDFARYSADETAVQGPFSSEVQPQAPQPPAEIQAGTGHTEETAERSLPPDSAQPAAVATAGETDTATPALLTEQGQQAASDLARFIRSDLDAATLVQNAETDPAYRAGLLAMFEQTGRDLQAQGHDIDIATYAEKTLRDLTGEIRMDESVAASSPAASEPVMPGQENSAEQAVVSGLSRGNPGDTPPASLQTPSMSDTAGEQEVVVPQVRDDAVPVIDLSALAMAAGDTREPEPPFIDMNTFVKEKPEPTRPAAGESQEQAATQSAERPAATAEAAGPAEEADGIVWGPRRPDVPQKEDLEKIIKSLTWEEQRDNTLLYRLDGEDAFRDLGNRLEMCNGASQDDRKVLAALAVAAKFYGGVIELTGSPEFKEKAMRLIIEHDLDIRMKIPAQRAQLEEMRKQMGATQDAVVPHQPTPDLNRHTPDATPQAAADQTTQATQEKTPAGPQPQVPIPPEPAAPGNTSPEAAEQAAPVPPAPGEVPAPSTPVSPDANAIKVPDMPEEPAPAALSPGESVTAVLMNFGEAMYENKEQRGNSFFIELQNRGGSHTYWGQDLRKLVQDHKAGDVVTLTLNSRDTWVVDGEERERVKNNWSLTAASTGIAVAHDRPEQGQQLQSFPVDTFGKLTQHIRQAWPEYMADLKLPARLEERQFYLGEDRHPVAAPQGAAGITPAGQDVPEKLTPVMASMDSQSKQMDLLLVQSAGEHLQGVVRLNGTLYPALASPTADNRQLVINAITDQGPRFAGYGQAVNFEPDGVTPAAPQLMTFHLKGREEDAPLPARLYTPEKQDDALFQRLGFEQTWKQWDDARKPEGRQEKVLHQEHSHSPGR
ncbi:DNA primase [Salmonella enterica subsp. enterica serovar Liverpool]|nr:DNA primase [Salmonella enterica subsp. enterica serovar Liverpool]